MNHELAQAARALAATVVALSVVLLPGAAPAMANSAKNAVAQAKVRQMFAASQRGSAYFVRDKAIRSSTCSASTAYSPSATSRPVQRASKSRLRSAPQWGLQRAARRGGKQSGTATAKAAPPEVVDQLRLVMRLLRREGARMGGGVSAASQRAIACIESNPGIQVGGLARELGIHQSTASNLVEKLARGGLVAKRRTVEDHRTVMLYATAKGRTALRAAPAQGADRLQQALAKLPAATLAALGEHLKGLVSHLKPDGARQA